MSFVNSIFWMFLGNPILGNKFCFLGEIFLLENEINNQICHESINLIIKPEFKKQRLPLVTNFFLREREKIFYTNYWPKNSYLKEFFTNLVAGHMCMAKN